MAAAPAAEKPKTSPKSVKFLFGGLAGAPDPLEPPSGPPDPLRDPLDPSGPLRSLRGPMLPSALSGTTPRTPQGPPNLFRSLSSPPLPSSEPPHPLADTPNSPQPHHGPRSPPAPSVTPREPTQPEPSQGPETPAPFSPLPLPRSCLGQLCSVSSSAQPDPPTKRRCPGCQAPSPNASRGRRGARAGHVLQQSPAGAAPAAKAVPRWRRGPPCPAAGPAAACPQHGRHRLRAAPGPGEEPHAAQWRGRQDQRVQDEPACRGQHPAQGGRPRHLHRALGRPPAPGHLHHHPPGHLHRPLREADGGRRHAARLHHQSLHRHDGGRHRRLRGHPSRGGPHPHDGRRQAAPCRAARLPERLRRPAADNAGGRRPHTVAGLHPHHGPGGGGQRRPARLLLAVQAVPARLRLLPRRHPLPLLCQHDQRAGDHGRLHARGHRQDAHPEHADDRREAGVPQRAGRAGEGGAIRGLLQPLEGLHAVLRPPGPPHRPHLHLPRADEQVLQEILPQCLAAAPAPAPARRSPCAPGPGGGTRNMSPTLSLLRLEHSKELSVRGGGSAGGVGARWCHGEWGPPRHCPDAWVPPGWGAG